MAARIQVSPALFSCTSILPSISRHVRRRNRSIHRLFSNESPPCGSASSSFVQAQRGFSFQEENFASSADFCVDAPLKIIKYPDPRLRAKNKRVNTFDDNLKKLVDEMFDVITDGIGLSAPQVGMNIQLMVFNPAGERGEGEEVVLVNPAVHKSSKKSLLYNEGCLSFPGIYADVVRPASVKIDARDVRGARFRLNLSGLPARVFQHEFDHLKGILFFDRMGEDMLYGIMSELKVLEKKYEDLTGQPSPENIDNHTQRQHFAGLAGT
ncbi:hypothetical protein KSP40_PGU017029 [Platanthera guangdongensis]|uniref:Peptide deformylase n=1 Tax=Platanthera guangdongensis TaxID=2320717 RepID=A0ABR2MW78_9ASPA